MRVRTPSLSHTFCERCVVIYQDETKNERVLLNNCPEQECQAILDYKNFRRDILAFNLINDIEVQCQGDQCEWKGVYSLYTKHKQDCKHPYTQKERSLNKDKVEEELRR